MANGNKKKAWQDEIGSFKDFGSLSNLKVKVYI